MALIHILEIVREVSFMNAFKFEGLVDWVELLIFLEFSYSKWVLTSLKAALLKRKQISLLNSWSKQIETEFNDYLFRFDPMRSIETQISKSEVINPLSIIKLF